MVAKLLVASEYTEPSFFIEKANVELDKHCNESECGLLLITKNIGLSSKIWQYAKVMYDIPIVTHITVTGLAGYSIEANTPEWERVKSEAMDFIEMTKLFGIDMSNIVLRVDPLVPEVTDFDHVDEIVKTFSGFGVTRCRTSVIDYYPFVRDKFDSVGIVHSGKFLPDRAVSKTMLRTMLDICNKYGMAMESCAENFDIDGMLKVGCADIDEWKRLGLEMEPGKPKRSSCFCNVNKIDLLAYEGYCGYNCLYCYWGKNRRINGVGK